MQQSTIIAKKEAYLVMMVQMVFGVLMMVIGAQFEEMGQRRKQKQQHFK